MKNNLPIGRLLAFCVFTLFMTVLSWATAIPERLSLSAPTHSITATHDFVAEGLVILPNREIAIIFQQPEPPTKPAFPVSFVYAISFSGKEYALASVALKENFLDVERFTLSLVAGYETRDTLAGVTGVGLNYRFYYKELFFTFGGNLLLSKPERPDGTISFEIGIWR